MQAQSYGAPGAMMSQPQPPATGSLSGATTPSQARPRVRARRGQATDPHSIAERVCSLLYLFSVYNYISLVNFGKIDFRLIFFLMFCSP